MTPRHGIVAALVALVALTTCFSASPGPNIVGQSAWISLHHQLQERNLCVPTSASIILDYFGDATSPREIKALTLNKYYVPGDDFTDFSITMFRDLIQGLGRLGYAWRERDYPNDDAGLRMGLADIERSLDGGVPVMIDSTADSAHTFIVAGYSVPNQLVFAMDPAMPSPGVRTLSFNALAELWNSRAVGFNGRAAVFPRRRTIFSRPLR